jgi:WD40 repeat protein
MSESHDFSGREQRLQEALVACLEAVESGRPPDREKLLARYPDCAAELDEFLSGREQVDPVAAPYRHVAAAAGGADTPPGLVADGTLPGTGTVCSFGDYELLEEIARGGMGVVFRARQRSLNRTVALKMILTGQLASAAEVQRFKAEAEAAAHLDHPNIVPIYEVGEHRGRHYFAMKLIDGGSLAQQVERFRTDPRGATRLMAIVARAVHYAHQHGVLHRDLKPGNILLDARGEPHVTDFGLAKRFEANKPQTQSGALVGTPGYMAPEQAAGHKGLTTAADVYGLGAILYELLTGRPPFKAETPLETLLQVVEREPERPRALNPAMDPDLETVCLKCLEKDARRRYGSAEALADDLERWSAGEPIEARPAGAWERTRKWARRRPALAALIAVSAGAALGVAILTSLFTLQLRGALEATRRQEEQAVNEKKLAEDRLWQSLLEQARAQRLAGARWQSLAALAEAARQHATPELRQEAIETITSPGVRLVCKLGPRSLAIGGEGPYLVFSADGRMLATSESLHTEGDDRPADGIKVWEVPSGKLLGQVRCAYYGRQFVFSPTAAVLAVSDYDQDEVRLWEPATGKVVARLRGKPPFAFSPDGKLLAVVDGKRVRAWDMARQEELAFAADGTPLAFLSPDSLVVEHAGRLHRWDVRTGKETFATPEGAVAQVWSPDARLAGLRPRADAPKRPVTLRDMNAGQERATLPDPGPLFSPSFLPLTPDAGLAALRDAAEPYSARLLDVGTGQSRGRLVIPGFAGTALYRGAFNPDGSLLAAMDAEQGNVRLWDVRTGNLLQMLPEQRCPTWSADGRYLAVFASGWFEPEDSPERRGGTDSHTRVYEVAAPTPTCRLASAVEALTFGDGGRRLLAQGSAWDVSREHGQVLLRPARVGPEAGLSYYAGPGGQVWAMRPRAEIKAPYALKVTQIAPERRELTLPVRQRPGAAAGLTPAPDGKALLLVWRRHLHFPGGGMAYSTRDQAELWDVSGAAPVQRWEKDGADSGGNLVGCFSPDGATVPVWDGRAIVLEDLKTGAERPLANVTMEEFPDRAVLHNTEQMRFTPDGRLLLCAFEDGRLAVVDVTAGQRLNLWKANQGDILSLAVSPDGKTLASGGEDGTVRLWDVATGTELARWQAHEAKVTALAYTPGGDTLASGSGDGTARLWDLPRIRKGLAGLGLDW